MDWPLILVSGQSSLKPLFSHADPPVNHSSIKNALMDAQCVVNISLFYHVL